MSYNFHFFNKDRRNQHEKNMNNAFLVNQAMMLGSPHVLQLVKYHLYKINISCSSSQNIVLITLSFIYLVEVTQAELLQQKLHVYAKICSAVQQKLQFIWFL